MALRRNILIFHAGALGDFVLTWPLAVALGRLYPQSRVFYVTHGQKGALAEKALRVESADVESGWHHLFSDPAALPEPCARLLSGAHTVVSFLSTPGDAWQENVRRLAPEATVLSLTTHAPPEFGGHLTSFILSQLQPSTAAHGALEQILRSVRARGIVASRAGGESIVIHPGAGAERKRWPLDKFTELARLLGSAGRSVRMVVGEVEAERWGEAAIKELGDVAKVMSLRTYLELFDELSRAAAFVGNDSGPGHLAGIIGVPTLSLFGPTDPTLWSPLGPKVKVLRREPLGDLTVEQVSAELRTLA